MLLKSICGLKSDIEDTLGYKENSTKWKKLHLEMLFEIQVYMKCYDNFTCTAQLF